MIDLKNICSKELFVSAEQQVKKYFNDINIKGRFLDVGAGNGIVSHYVSTKFGCDVVSIDTYNKNGNEENDKDINLNVKNKLNDKVEIIISDIADYKTDDLFDIVYAKYALHHIYTTTDRFIIGTEVFNKALPIFEHLYSLMKQNGILIIVEVFCLTTENKYYESHIKTVYFPTKHSPEEWSLFLNKVGFKNICVDYYFPTGIPDLPIEEKIKLYGYEYRIKATK